MTSFRDQAQSLAATGLTGAAKLLRVSADAMSGVASLLRPGALDDERPKRPSAAVDPVAPWDDIDIPGDEATRAGLTEDEATQDGLTEDVAEDETTAASDATVSEPPQVPTQEVTHASVAPSHVAELAEGTVAEITGALDALSTDELRLLLEHETTHRKRKGVLDAIEQALTS